jgi:uncharacterized protein (TIGR00730 family)
MNKKIEKVTIYCASSDKIDYVYFSGAAKIAEILVEKNIEILFGGGAKGLMGQLADTASAMGGKIVGIMPVFMKEVEWQHNGLSELILVKDMHERKKKLLENTDAVIALPGGSGTLEELLEVITLKKLGVFTGPIIIFNQNNYYRPLIDMFEKCIEENFMREKHREIWTVITKPDELMNALRNAPHWDESAISFAAV